MKDYVRPMMESEVFAANEYIAACGEVPTSYKFVCDKESEYHGGIIFGHYSSLYYYDTSGRARELGAYDACGETHLAPTTDSFFRGFVDNNENGREDANEGCYVWIEYDWRGRIDDWHATTNMDPNSWEKNHS